MMTLWLIVVLALIVGGMYFLPGELSLDTDFQQPRPRTQAERDAEAEAEEEEAMEWWLLAEEQEF